MPTYKVTCYVEASDANDAMQTLSPGERSYGAYVERHYTQAEYDAYQEECCEHGDVPCSDPAGHVWVVSDEDENYCYCEKCGCCEY